MALAGRLELEFATNIARLQQDASQAKGIVSNMARDMNQALATVRSAFGALGVGLSTTAFFAVVKGATDAMDALGDLSRTTRVAADELAGLGFAAKQNGGDLQGAAQNINILAREMGKNADKFRALGVTARDPIEAMKQLADVTNAITDPQQRAAVLSEALGRSWERVAPLLAEGSAKMGELIDKGREYSGVTEENVRLADEFNDKLGELSASGAGGVNEMVGKLLPLLNATADGLIAAGQGSTIWSTAGESLAEVLRVVLVLGGNVSFVLKGIGNEIGGLAAQAAAVAVGDFSRAAEIGRMMKSDAEENRKAFDAWEKSIMAVGSASASTTRNLDGMDQVSRRAANEAAAAARAFLKGEEDKKKAIKEAAEAAKQAQEARNFSAQVEAESEKDAAEAWAFYWKYYVDERNKHFMEAAAAREAATKAEVAAEEMFAEDYAEAWKYWNDYVRNEDRKREHELRDQARVWNEIGDVAGDFFVDLVSNGKSAFDNLGRFVKDLLKQMIALFAKRWILNMAAGGSVLGAAGDALAGGTGSGSMAGSVLSGASSLLGTSFGIGGAGLGASVWGAMGAGTVATETGVVLATGSMAGTSIGTGAMAGVYSALAAIPVWGWIAMAVVAIGAWIAGNHKGGPKVGGSFFEGGAVPGMDNGRFFTPNQGDDVMRQMVEATSSGYQDAISRLGGTAGDFNFGLGFDHDPHGTAMSRVSALLTDAQGNEIYRVQDRNMDDKEVEGALGLEMQRMILAALQNSDLHDALDEYFDGVTDIANLSAEEIQKILAGAMELHAVIQGLSQLNANGLDINALRAWQREGESISQTFQRIAGQFAAFDDAFMTDAQKFVRAQEMIADAFVAMGIAIPQDAQAFYDLVHGLDLSTEAGRAMFDSLMQIAPAFLQVENVVATTIARFNSIASTLSPSFGAANARSVLEARASAWMNLDPANAAGWTVESTIANIGSIIASGNLGDALTYAQSLGDSAVGVLNDMLQAYADWQSALKNSNSGVTTITSNLGDLGASALDAAERLATAKDGLRSYLDSLLLNETLSPLGPQERLAEAQRQYEAVLAAAQGGDLAAISNLAGTHSTYIELARQLLGSGADFQAIFRNTFAEVGGVAGFTQADVNARLYSALPQSSTLFSAADSQRLAEAVINAVMASSSMIADRIERAMTDAAERQRQPTTAGGLGTG